VSQAWAIIFVLSILRVVGTIVIALRYRDELSTERMICDGLDVLISAMIAWGAVEMIRAPG
jgi:hypothetical protein